MTKKLGLSTPRIISDTFGVNKIIIILPISAFRQNKKTVREVKKGATAQVSIHQYFASCNHAE